MFKLKEEAEEKQPNKRSSRKKAMKKCLNSFTGNCSEKKFRIYFFFPWLRKKRCLSLKVRQAMRVLYVVSFNDRLQWRSILMVRWLPFIWLPFICGESHS